MSKNSHNALPAGALPRGLNRVQAAEYIGVSPSKFDELVHDGRMPEARRIDGRLVWDVRELDVAFDALPRNGGSPARTAWDDAA